jgi:hypothetical protein
MTRRRPWLLTSAGSAVAGGIALALIAQGSVFAVDEVVISQPQFEAPTVVSPVPGEPALVVTDSDGTAWWILEVTNSDYQADFDIDTGYVGFETLPSVGIFDSVEERLEWTNHTFSCFLDDSCDGVARTADQVAFGDDFVRLPKLYVRSTDTVAYHAEHAYGVGQDPYEWLVSQDTLSLAIPLDPSPTGTVDIWVGYTYIYTDDLVGVPVRFTRDAMAVTQTRVTIPEAPDAVGQDAGSLADEPITEGAPLPTWVWSAVIGLVGVIVFFGLIALTVSRGVVLARRNK